MAYGNKRSVRFGAVASLLLASVGCVCGGGNSPYAPSPSSTAVLRSRQSSTAVRMFETQPSQHAVETLAQERILVWNSFWWNWFPSPSSPARNPAPAPTPTPEWNSFWTNWWPSPPSRPVRNPPAPTPTAPVASPLWPTPTAPIWVPSPVARPPVAAPIRLPSPVAQPVAAPVGGGGQAAAAAAAWLSAHNTRRRAHHNSHSVSYVPLQWSSSLATSAQQYTNKLLDNFSDCHIQHNYDGDSYGGENLAATYGGSNHSPEYILSLWYDGEEHLPYPQNGHRTQVAWRATRYVGCYSGSKQLGNGLTCVVHTCRYVTPGNCNGPNGILDDVTPCTPQCPTEGCA